MIAHKINTNRYNIDSVIYILMLIKILFESSISIIQLL